MVNSVSGKEKLCTPSAGRDWIWDKSIRGSCRMMCTRGLYLCIDCRMICIKRWRRDSYLKVSPMCIYRRTRQILLFLYNETEGRFYFWLIIWPVKSQTAVKNIHHKAASCFCLNKDIRCTTWDKNSKPSAEMDLRKFYLKRLNDRLFSS